jgi:hypothetical protein
MIGKELPKNGQWWHQIRSGDLWSGENCGLWSKGLRELVSGMMSPDPKLRFSAKIILGKYLLSEKELDVKAQKFLIRKYKEKIVSYQQDLREQGIRARRRSI